MPATYKTIDEYIKTCPKDVQAIVQEVREAIKEIVPEAEECISYSMPTFKLNGKDLVYFKAWKAHLGFYALPTGTAAYQKELTNYKTGRGCIQFPLDKPMPIKLIQKIVKFRKKELQAK